MLRHWLFIIWFLSRFHARFQWAAISCQATLPARCTTSKRCVNSNADALASLNIHIHAGWFGGVFNHFYSKTTTVATTAAHIQLSRVRNVVELQTLAVKPKLFGLISSRGSSRITSSSNNRAAAAAADAYGDTGSSSSRGSSSSSSGAFKLNLKCVFSVK